MKRKRVKTKENAPNKKQFGESTDKIDSGYLECGKDLKINSQNVESTLKGTFPYNNDFSNNIEKKKNEKLLLHNFGFGLMKTILRLKIF